MKNIFLIGFVGLLLSGCGGDMICDCFDGCDDAISFTFDANGSINGFKPEEIDSVLLYKLAKGQSNILDSALFTKKAGQYDYHAENSSHLCGTVNTITLNDGSPFYSSLEDFDYVISVPKIKAYKITNLMLEGYNGGECSCYINTKKLVSVNGVSYDLTDKPFQQNAIVLTK